MIALCRIERMNSRDANSLPFGTEFQGSEPLSDVLLQKSSEIHIFRRSLPRVNKLVCPQARGFALRLYHLIRRAVGRAGRVTELSCVRARNCTSVPWALQATSTRWPNAHQLLHPYRERISLFKITSFFITRETRSSDVNITYNRQTHP